MELREEPRVGDEAGVASSQEHPQPQLAGAAGPLPDEHVVGIPSEKTPATAQPPVLHGIEGGPRPETPPAVDDAPCAHCGGPLPQTSSGRARRDARFCRPSCRHAATRKRRTAAREEVRSAAADVVAAAERLSEALRTLGILPARTPRGRRRPAPPKPIGSTAGANPIPPSTGGDNPPVAAATEIPIEPESSSEFEPVLDGLCGIPPDTEPTR